MGKLSIEEMQNIAKNRGGKCLSTEYVNINTKLKWQCAKGHIWETTPSVVKQGKWCLDCSGKKKLSITEMSEIAKSRGGKCLSTEYINTSTPLKWQCKNGHIWEARAMGVKRGNWCSICSGNNKLNIEIFQKLAKSRGGKCLSTEYTNNATSLIWECANGHTWSAVPATVKFGSWCLKCSGKERLSIEEMKDFAKSKGGECLSDSYKNIKQKLKWKCSEGHIWEATANQIRTALSWCPICSAGVSERITQKYFELIFNKDFPKIRPFWLVNERGNRMELDGYNKELKLAFEYQGAQHYLDITFFYKKNRLEQRIQDDRYKKKLCIENNVNLIAIPYIVNHEKIYDYIINELIRCKINIPKHSKKEVHELDIFSKHNLEELNKIAEKRGGSCLSDYYIDSSTKLKWKCSEGHIWEARPSSIRYGIWCAKCSVKKRADLARGSLADMKKIAQNNGGHCLSKTYINSRIPMEWDCKNGHKFIMSAREVTRGVWCAKCYGNKKLGIKDMQILAIEKGGRCLSEVYKNSKTKLKWQCSKGHTWEQRQDIIRAGSWCPICANYNKKNNFTIANL